MDYRDRLIHYSEAEEMANRLTHGAGLLLFSAASAFLILRAVATGEPLQIVGSSVYGLSLVLFYSMSTLYHTVGRPKVKYVFRILDHATIYLLIAGTYTPFTLVTLNGPWGWSIFGVVWGLALAGALFKVWMTHRLRILGPIFYILLGWMIVVAIKPLLASLPMAGVLWLLAGGVFYTAGVGVYAWDRIPFNHAIWHLFVLAGSACHYLAILWYVIGG